MRKGYMLTEIMVVAMVLPIVAIVLDGLFKTLLHDIPRSSHVVQENTTLLGVLEQVQRDVDKAKALPESFAGRAAGENLLLIELADETICYELQNGKVLRSKLNESDPNDNQKITVWSAPNAQMRWQVWRKDGAGYAVEVQTHIRHKLRRMYEKKMANSHLYFAGAL